MIGDNHVIGQYHHPNAAESSVHAAVSLLIIEHPFLGLVMAQTTDRHELNTSFHDKSASIKIYQSIYKNTIRVSNGVTQPIQVGCALTDDHYGILRDDTGDNVSHLNRMYGELTAHYWAWKNDRDSAYIGLCHYRRLFVFKPGLENLINFGGDRITIPQIEPTSETIFGWGERDVVTGMQGYDIVIPLLFHIKDDPFRPRDCGEQFVLHHGLDNYRELLRLIELHTPEHVPYAEQFFAGDTMYVANMFVMRRDLFDAYSAWLFRMLDAIRENVDCTHLDAYQVRMPAFMAERLFNIYIMRLRETEPDLNIKEIPYVIIENTGAPAIPLQPITGRQRVVPIVTNFDENYVGCFSACLVSLAEAANPDIYYDVIILADDISQPYRDLLTAQTATWPNVKIRYIDMSGEFGRPAALHGPFTKATFFRLKLTELLPSHDKVIFIDPDTIILEDIGKLFEIDVSEVYAAGVIDYSVQVQLATNFKIGPEFGGVTRQEYWDNLLQLSPRAQQSYLNAGVMIFNLVKMRSDRCGEQFRELFWNQKFDLLDQDIVNKVFDGCVLALDQRWNVIPEALNVRVRLPVDLFDKYMAARKNPAVLHFAGRNLKPWNAYKIDFFEYFWLFARKTPFYESLLDTYIRNRMVARMQQGLEDADRQLSSRLNNIVDRLAVLEDKLRIDIGRAARPWWRVFAFRDRN